MIASVNKSHCRNIENTAMFAIEIIVSILVEIVANLIAYYIIKRLN